MTMESPDQVLKRAMAAHQAGELSEAAALYQQILSAWPTDPDALHLLGVIHCQSGNAALGIPFIEKAIAENPNFAEFHRNLAIAFTSLGDHEQSLREWQVAARLQPDQVIPLERIYRLLVQLGRDEAALEPLNQLIQLQPENPAYHLALGLALKTLDRDEDAINSFKAVLALDPSNIHALNNAGMLFRKAKRYDEAIAFFEQAARRHPNVYEVRNNLANAYSKKKQFEKAIEVFDAALKLRPDSYDVHLNLGISLIEMCRPAEAEPHLRRAMELKPGAYEPRWNFAYSLLIRGDFERGWVEHESRYQLPTVKNSIRHTDLPMWDGSDLHGRSILLHAEQGFGDTIQFSRYVPMVRERGGRILFECPPELVAVYENFPGIDELSSNIRQADVQCPLPSLPLVLQTRLEIIPSAMPYLVPSAARVAAWREKLGPSTGRPRIGLCWSGRPSHANDENRSMAPTWLDTLRDVPADWISLQKPPPEAGEARPDLPMMELGHEITDFADTAAIVSQLDLVITVDTAIAHVAGALGKPAWVMLAYCPDWRWMLQRSDSPWYPTMRLFRQPTAGDWHSVVQFVRRALQIGWNA